MSPWFLNFFFVRVVGQMNKRAMGKGVILRDENGVGWEIKQVLYADDDVWHSAVVKHGLVNPRIL